MTEEISRLSNGLTVVTHTMPHLETTSLGIWVGVGSRHEAPDENGISHLLEHMSFKGTASRTAQAIAEEIEAVGGELNAATGLETTAYFARVLKGDEGVALKMDTHHEATATIVTAAQGRLVDELRQQGVRVAGAEVTCTPGETGRQSQSQSQNRASAPDTAHLIETATERTESRHKTDSEARAANRRGRFA